MSESVQEEFLAAAWMLCSVLASALGYHVAAAIAGVLCGLALLCAITAGWQEAKAEKLARGDK